MSTFVVRVGVHDGTYAEEELFGPFHSPAIAQAFADKIETRVSPLEWYVFVNEVRPPRIATVRDMGAFDS